MAQALDRTIAPPIGPVGTPQLPTYHSRQLSNGIQVHLLPYGSVEVVTIQAVYQIGKNHQQHIGQFNYTAKMMLEGTASYNSLQIAQTLDSAGGWITYDANEASMVFKTATLSANLPNVLPVFEDVILRPTFPEKEFERHKRQGRERLIVAAQKTKTKAVRAYRHAMFGAEHPYGRHMGVDELAPMTLDSLRSCWDQFLGTHEFFLTVVGNFDEEQVIALLEKHFGHVDPQAFSLPENQALLAPQYQQGRVQVPHEGLQATLRMGHRSVNRSHPDFYALTVLNTIFGGYFGSRLMKNIREEKGYTYGISSGIVAMRHHGHFVIQTDVGKEYIEPTLTEVDHEMRKLQAEQISADELALVKNYLVGRGISQRETPWQIAEILTFSLTSGLPFTELDRRFEVISQLQEADIQKLAQEYLHPDNLLIVITDGSA